MPNWKKVAVSGSAASFSSLSVDTSITASIVSSSQFTGSLFGTASYALTASSATQFNVTQALTASGLIYPIADNGEKSFIQTDGNGNLSLQYVDTIFEAFYAAESVPKGTPLYFSGSQGANPRAFAADASNPSKMPVVVVATEALTAGNIYEGVVLGLIEGIDLTGYTAGQTVYVAEGGGWSTSLPSGSNSITQVLGIVTKGGNGGKGLVLNPGPAQLPGLQTGYTWVGNGSNQPTAVTTSSIQNVVSSSYALTASYAANASVVVTGSNAILNQTSAATTWSFNHNLNNQYPVFQVFDSSNNVVIPQNIVATDTTTATIYFPTAIAGTAVASIGGYTGSVTASYVLSASYAATASYLNPITDSYILLSQVSQSLDFADDTAAAAGGVPLGGLYRNGNFILIRIS